MKAIVAENLTKIYASGKQALEDVSFSIGEGEIFGFLGPNGAGKTTTVKLLNAMLSPSAGAGRVFGLDPGREPEKVHMLCGVVTEHAQMYNHLTGMQNLIFYGTLFGLSSEKSRSRAAALLEQLSLLESAGQKLGTYSTGMRQRLSLARALMHSPKLLFLDEPTAGLDPQSTQEVNHLIQSLAKTQGVTVFLCTHQLRYAQEICTSYGLIDGGHMLAEGRLEQLRAIVCPGVTVTLRASSYPPDLPGQETEEGWEISLGSEEEIPELIRKIVEQGGNIYHVSARRPSLEEIYFALTQRQGREAVK